MRTVTSMRGWSSSGCGTISKPVTRVDAMIPARPHAHQRQRMRNVLAAGAQGRRGPQIHDDAARIIALVLQVAAHHLRAPRARRGPRRRGSGWRADRGSRDCGRSASRRAVRATASPPARARRSGRRGARADPRARPRRRRRARRGPSPKTCRPSRTHDFGEVAEMRVERASAPRPWRDRGVDAAKRGEARSPRRGRGSRAATSSARRGSSTCAEEYSSTSSRRTAMSSVQVGGRDRRRHMAERDAAEPALGGRRLAGIVDDEGIDHRQRAHGKARRSSRPKARRPCRAATRSCHACRDGSARRRRSHLAQAEIERQIGMASAARRDRDRTPCGRRRGRGRAAARRERFRRARPRNGRRRRPGPGRHPAGPQAVSMRLRCAAGRVAKPGLVGVERDGEWSRAPGQRRASGYRPSKCRGAS